MILAIAERVHDPDMTDDEVRRWAKVWRRDRLRAILSTPAMVLGSTRSRLVRATGMVPDKIINLLPPDNQIGTWDHNEALISALTLKVWLREEPKLWVVASEGPVIRTECYRKVTGVLLLGKRVAEAFHLPVSWGAMFRSQRHPPMILLPHPSGRCRIWNEQAFRDRMVRSVAAFLSLARGVA